MTALRRWLKPYIGSFYYFLTHARTPSLLPQLRWTCAFRARTRQMHSHKSESFSFSYEQPPFAVVAVVVVVIIVIGWHQLQYFQCNCEKYGAHFHSSFAFTPPRLSIRKASEVGARKCVCVPTNSRGHSDPPFNHPVVDVVVGSEQYCNAIIQCRCCCCCNGSDGNWLCNCTSCCN